MSWHEHTVLPDQRRLVLKTLEEDPGYSHNENVLRSALAYWGHSISRDGMRHCLTWLFEAGLIELHSSDPTWTAKLTARGEDVALGRTVAHGVARPPLG